jgi:hypothetical protein
MFDMNQIINSFSLYSQNQFRKLLEGYHVHKLSLFGSALRDDFTPESDIDLLAEFEPDQLPSIFELVDIQERLSKFFEEREVDLRTYEDLSRYFRDEVFATTEIIYEQ